MKPQTRRFPATDVGATSEPRLVKVFNPKNRKQKLVLTFLGAENTGEFAIVAGSPTTCDTTLDPRAHCSIALTVSPTAAGLRTGALMVADNAELNAPQLVKLKGKGKQVSSVTSRTR